MMNFFLMLLYMLFFYACSLSSTLKEKESPDKKKLTKIFNEKYVIRPGEVIRVHFPLPSNEKVSHFYCKDKEVIYYSYEDYNEAYLSESYFSNYSPYRCYYSDREKKERHYLMSINILKKYFKSEKLRVNKKRVTLNKKDLKRVLKEQKILNKLYKKVTAFPYFKRPFLLPLSSKVTSVYGTRRVFNNNKKTQHLGTDFRAKVGELIKSSNRGKVILAQDLFYSGKTVIVDHGMGIYSVYGHLSKLLVKVGAIVPSMGRLGLAGATGRVTGPHLHWGVKVHGNWVEGASLVKLF